MARWQEPNIEELCILPFVEHFVSCFVFEQLGFYSESLLVYNYTKASQGEGLLYLMT